MNKLKTIKGLYSFAGFRARATLIPHPTDPTGHFEYRRVLCPRCTAVKQERITWLALSKRFTQRYEDQIGRLCRTMSIKDVAELQRLEWHQVKRRDMASMQRLVDQHPPSENLRAIGIDEVSLRKGHTYAIVVAD